MDYLYSGTLIVLGSSVRAAFEWFEYNQLETPISGDDFARLMRR